jgi:hypothetical protein
MASLPLAYRRLSAKYLDQNSTGGLFTLARNAITVATAR